MQVCREDCSSLTGSKASSRGKPVNPCSDPSKTEMCTVSVLADASKPAFCLPGSADIPDRPSCGDLNTNIDSHPRKDAAEHHLNLRQYVIAPSRMNCSNKEINDMSELPQNADHVNAHMCKAFPCTTSIPDTDTPSPNSSSANPELRPDFSQSSSGSSATDSSEENSMAGSSCEPVYEEVQAPVSMSTLPNLATDGLLLECGDQTPAMYGHSSCVISSRC